MNWSKEDVISVAEEIGMENGLSNEQAQIFLDNNHKHIEEAATRAGFAAIETLLETGFGSFIKQEDKS